MGSKRQGMARVAWCPSSPTRLANAASSHAPQTEFHLLLMNEELSRLLLKSDFRTLAVGLQPQNSQLLFLPLL